MFDRTALADAVPPHANANAKAMARETTKFKFLDEKLAIDPPGIIEQFSEGRVTCKDDLLRTLLLLRSRAAELKCAGRRPLQH